MSFRLATYLCCGVLLAGCGTAAGAAGGGSPPAGKFLPALPGHSTVPRLNASQLAAFVSRPIPGRNLYDLTNQLKLRPPRAISKVVRRTSPNYAVGHRDIFWVLSEDKLQYFKMHATIHTVTPHLYIYVQDGLKVDEAAIQHSAAVFEHHTYPTDRALYGSEWTPGVDGDPHLTCLLGDLKASSIAGAFSAEDEYPKVVNPYSNQREMFYINANTLPGQGAFDVTLAHEFQHMIHWHMHPRDNAWLNEGMSMLAQVVNGYGAQTLSDAFPYLQQPDTQLDTWGATDNSTHYGGSLLFMDYLYTRFGRSFIRDMLADRAYTDFALIDDVLRRHHITESADQVFGDWVVANEVNDQSLAGGRYGYHDLPQKASIADTRSVPFSVQSQLAPYAVHYLEIPKIDQQKPFRLQFTAAQTVPLVGLPGTVPFWWSNRGDLIDTRLQRTVDLTHVHQAHLHFRAWYDIENTYDYAYVEASTDGGRTWTTLPGTHTTRTNPTGANFGNGYTGELKAWTNESVNLSRYAGKRIQIRFEYITDDATNFQGFVISKIAIPEIGYHDTFRDWTLQGFAPVATNALPSHWQVRLIEDTAHGHVVRSLPLSAASGSVLIDPGKAQLKKLVIAVFTAAPKTTVKSTYQLSTQAVTG